MIKEIKKPPDLKEGERVKRFLDLVNLNDLKAGTRGASAASAPTFMRSAVVSEEVYVLVNVGSVL